MWKWISAALLLAALICAPVLASAQTPAPAPTAAAQTKKKPLSAGMAAARERQKKCGAEWKEAKAAGKVEKGVTWPKYWSACNKRLKAGS